MNLTKMRKAKQNKLVIELFRKGIPMKEILEETKCSRSTVYRIVSKNDMTIRKVNKPKKDWIVRLDEETKDFIVADYMIHVKTKDILEKYKISRSTMYRILKERSNKENKYEI